MKSKYAINGRKSSITIFQQFNYWTTELNWTTEIFLNNCIRKFTVSVLF